MPTTQHSNFIELYRLYKEMVDESDFIQTLERLRSGAPSESKDSDSASVAAGLNRPLARLSHNIDAVLETLQTTRTSSINSDDVVLDWDGSTLTIGAGTISFRFSVTGLAGNDSGNPGVFEFTTTSASLSTLSIAEGSIAYISIDRSLTSAQDFISNIDIATFETFSSNLQDAEYRLKYVPIAYNSSGCLNFFCNNISLISGCSFDLNTGVSSFYAKSSTLNKLANYQISGSGITSSSCSWTTSSNTLSFPSFIIRYPTGSITVSGGSVTIASGEFAYVTIGSTSVSTASTLDFDDDSIEGIFLIANRDGNVLYLYNGIPLATITDHTDIPFVTGHYDTQGLWDLNTRDHYDPTYRLRIKSESLLTSNRYLSVNVNDANRVLDLAANVEVNGDLTIGTGGLTTGTSAVSFDANGFSIGSSGEIVPGAGDVTFSNSANIEIDQSLTTTSDVTFGSIDLGSSTILGSSIDFIYALGGNDDKYIRVTDHPNNVGDSLWVQAGGGLYNGGALNLSSGASGSSYRSQINFYTSDTTDTTPVRRGILTSNGCLALSEFISNPATIVSNNYVLNIEHSSTPYLMSLSNYAAATRLEMPSSGSNQNDSIWTTTLGSFYFITDASSQSIYLDATLDVQLDADRNINLNSSQDINLNSTQDINLNSTLDVQISTRTSNSGTDEGITNFKTDTIRLNESDGNYFESEWAPFIIGEMTTTSEGVVNIENHDQTRIMTFSNVTPSLYLNSSLGDSTAPLMYRIENRSSINKGISIFLSSFFDSTASDNELGTTNIGRLTLADFYSFSASAQGGTAHSSSDNYEGWKFNNVSTSSNLDFAANTSYQGKPGHSFINTTSSTAIRSIRSPIIPIDRSVKIRFIAAYLNTSPPNTSQRLRLQRKFVNTTDAESSYRTYNASSGNWENVADWSSSDSTLGSASTSVVNKIYQTVVAPPTTSGGVSNPIGWVFRIIYDNTVSTTSGTWRISPINMTCHKTAEEPSIRIVTSSEEYAYHTENPIEVLSTGGDTRYAYLSINHLTETATWSPFTGSHQGTLSEGNEAELYDLVKVVSVLGKETYEVIKTSTQKDKSAIGSFCPVPDSQDLIYCVGNGKMKVCSQGGNIEIGDFLCSSDVAGAAMNQGEDVLKNYTVAKSMSSVVWEEDGPTEKIIDVVYVGG